MRNLEIFKSKMALIDIKVILDCRAKMDFKTRLLVMIRMLLLSKLEILVLMIRNIDLYIFHILSYYSNILPN